ncbi:hypothetical protein M885DRAFT_562392 [Pelagophyceae sp. CCMP2097]|nr:hypothetical protein M885DRAFT_562392 [Pelagophyceae sp. CCMP2097]
MSTNDKAQKLFDEVSFRKELLTVEAAGLEKPEMSQEEALQSLVASYAGTDDAIVTGIFSSGVDFSAKAGGGSSCAIA